MTLKESKELVEQLKNASDYVIALVDKDNQIILKTGGSAPSQIGLAEMLKSKCLSNFMMRITNENK